MTVQEEDDEAEDVAVDDDPNVEEKTPEVILRIQINQPFERLVFQKAGPYS